MAKVISGTVTIKVHGLLKQKQLPGSWGVLYEAGGKGKPPYIELYEAENATRILHSVSLEHLKFSDKAYQQADGHFVLSVKKEKYHFQFPTAEEKQDWVHSLCHVSKELWKQRASSPESSEHDHNEDSLDMSENLLYESFEKVHQFKVSINPTNSSKACNLQGHYFLSPTKDSLRLLEMDSMNTIHEWPYRYIRKYGRTRQIFKVEVGRRCTTGEGEFEFFTPDGASLGDLIKKQMQISLQQQSHVSPPPALAPEAEYIEGLSLNEAISRGSAQSVSTPSVHHAAAEHENNTPHTDSSSSFAKKRADSSHSCKRDAPIPAPRSSNASLTKQLSVTAESTRMSNSAKIYETANGLTAPLESNLKQELASKLHVQMSDGGNDASVVQNVQKEDDSVTDTTDKQSGTQSSCESIKDKKKSDKTKKKEEKERKAEEMKQRKKHEKELKEQKEKEAKAEKERLKQLKKSKTTLKGKKSVDLSAEPPAPISIPEGSIYDEPGELLPLEKSAFVSPPSAGYEDADQFVSNQVNPANLANQNEPDIYSKPQKPLKDSWKTQGRDEAESVHEEDYDGIKKAALTNNNLEGPPVPPFSPSRNSVSHACDVESAYSHLGDIKQGAKVGSAPENVYGIASGTETVKPQKLAPRSAFEGGNEYEDADTVQSAARIPQGASATSQIELEEGDYASVL